MLLPKFCLVGGGEVLDLADVMAQLSRNLAPLWRSVLGCGVLEFRILLSQRALFDRMSAYGVK